MAIKTIICDRCGKPYESSAYNARYCPECRPKARREYHAERRVEYTKPKIQERPQPSISVAEIQAIGRKRGMTYGQTVVWLKYHHPNGRRKNV